MRLSQQFVELNASKHLIKKVDCKKESMNTFLVRVAAKHAKLSIGTTMVLTEEDNSLDKQPVAAYYTLGLSIIHREEIPASGLPTYPIPVTLLARLAVDVNFQGKKLGSKSLIYALRHAVRLNNHGLPTHGLVLDVLDAQALSFYKTFNFFQEFSNDPMKLYVSMKELQKL